MNFPEKTIETRSTSAAACAAQAEGRELRKTAVDVAAVAHQKLIDARLELNQRLIDREEEIDICLTALVAGEHPLFVGPPGTGKSMLGDAVAELLHGTKFSYLMTKFTAPEEVFGPISLRGLQNDEYVRVTKGKLPEAEVAFLDEIFKSSSAVLNTLLKILNERTYDAGRGAYSVPLRLCVAASNEWPGGEGQQELGALFDRFIFRKTVKPISSAAGRDRLRWDRSKPKPLTVQITKAELEAAQAEAAQLPWSADAKAAFGEIVQILNKEGIFPGDRRERKAVGAVQAAAWLDGALEVKKDHLSILDCILWDAPEEQPQKCASIVASVANPVGFKVGSLLAEAEQIMAGVNLRNLAEATACTQKLAEVITRFDELKGNSKADRARTYLVGRLKAMRMAAIDAA